MNYYHAIEQIEASEQEELLEMYELFDTRNKGKSPLIQDSSILPLSWRP